MMYQSSYRFHPSTRINFEESSEPSSWKYGFILLPTDKGDAFKASSAAARK